MLPSQFLLPSRIATSTAIDDEARPLSNTKRGIWIQRDTKPRLFMPPRVAHRMTLLSTKRKSTVTTATTIPAMNVVAWMQEECPSDVLPKILAYAGPQMAAVLNQTNRFWREVFQDESTWRIMCEELYKVRSTACVVFVKIILFVGIVRSTLITHIASTAPTLKQWKDGDKLPDSWKDYYRHTPCVPTDYPSILAALATASDHDEHINHDPCNMNPRVMEQRRSIKILLRPGDYYMREAIVVQAVGDNTCVTIESMELPQFEMIFNEADHSSIESATQTGSPARRMRGVMMYKAKTLRQALTCRSVSEVETEEIESDVLPPTAVRASLISRTRRLNEPLIRVRQGTVKLVNLNVAHNANGVDIWNGNAAIQIQPPIGPDDTPFLSVPQPRAILDHVDVCSKSGRGIVTIDGGSTRIASSYIHDCAATGIYVGGAGSSAVIRRTDVLRNGNGNRMARRGVQRGHSGIYLEQGRAVIRDCNVSQNSLTGISAVSQENAVLELSESDLVANGAQQLEMPPNGSLSRRRSLTRDNNMAATGYFRSRSGLVESD